jgi:hypothetical protein
MNLVVADQKPCPVLLQLDLGVHRISEKIKMFAGNGHPEIKRMNLRTVGRGHGQGHEVQGVVTIAPNLATEKRSTDIVVNVMTG